MTELFKDLQSKLNFDIPNRYEDLLNRIDYFIWVQDINQYIFGEMLILAKKYYSEALYEYENALAEEMKKNDNIPATTKKDISKANCMAQRKKLIDAEYFVDKYHILRDSTLERLNSYKKIKGGN